MSNINPNRQNVTENKIIKNTQKTRKCKRNKLDAAKLNQQKTSHSQCGFMKTRSMSKKNESLTMQDNNIISK